MAKDPRSDLERLAHIAEALDLIQSFCKDKDVEEFIADKQLTSSVLYQFIVIGEAVRAIEPDLLAKYPYPWHLPRSFRNYIAHEYFGINLRQVYKTVTDILPDFKILIDKIIATESFHP